MRLYRYKFIKLISNFIYSNKKIFLNKYLISFIILTATLLSVFSIAEKYYSGSSDLISSYSLTTYIKQSKTSKKINLNQDENLKNYINFQVFTMAPNVFKYIQP